MYSLWELLRDAYQSLGQLQVAQADGGSETTLVDGKLSPDSRDSDWVGAGVLILQAGGEAPEGEFAQVSGYASSTGTLTFDALAGAVEAGDTYGLTGLYYPLMQMIELANLALCELGDIPLVEVIPLDGCQVSWRHNRPYRVDIRAHSGESGEDGWETVFWWEFVPAAPDESGWLNFDRDFGGGKDLRVWYHGRHSLINAYDDAIYEGFAPALAGAALTEMALRWQNSRLGGENSFLMQRWNDAKNELGRMKAGNPVWQPPLSARMRLAGRPFDRF